MAELARRRRTLKRGTRKPPAVDSSMYESRHVSRHVERRREQTARRRPRVAAAASKKGRASGARASIAAAAGS
jgi:hypothetical protein